VQIRSQWDVTMINIQHKLGDCPISEISVLIAVSSPHRTESLHAVEFAINELKKTVPIWKKVLSQVYVSMHVSYQCSFMDKNIY
jgi:molybdopterin synthase catalytic subunit